MDKYAKLVGTRDDGGEEHAEIVGGDVSLVQAEDVPAFKAKIAEATKGGMTVLDNLTMGIWLAKDNPSMFCIGEHANIDAPNALDEIKRLDDICDSCTHRAVDLATSALKFFGMMQDTKGDKRWRQNPMAGCSARPN